MKKLDGACTLPDSDWRESRSIVSFLLDLGNVTRMEGSVLIFMIPQKSLSVLSSWMVYVLLPTANWHIRFFIYGVLQIEYGLLHLLICLKSEVNWFFYAGYSRENARLFLFLARCVWIISSPFPLFVINHYTEVFMVGQCRASSLNLRRTFDEGVFRVWWSYSK